MHLLLLQQKKKAINHLDFIKLKLKLCACDGIMPFKTLHVSRAPPLWICAKTHMSPHLLLLLCPHQAHIHIHTHTQPQHSSTLIMQDENVPIRMSASSKEKKVRKKIQCPSTSEGPERREGKGKERGGGKEWGGG